MRFFVSRTLAVFWFGRIPFYFPQKLFADGDSFQWTVTRRIHRRECRHVVARQSNNVRGTNTHTRLSRLRYFEFHAHISVRTPSTEFSVLKTSTEKIYINRDFRDKFLACACCGKTDYFSVNVSCVRDHSFYSYSLKTFENKR